MLLQDQKVGQVVAVKDSGSKDDADNFFESDRDIEARERRQKKSAGAVAKNGSPIKVASKVLDMVLSMDWMALCLGKNQDIKEVYIAESGFIARKLHLQSQKSVIFKGHQGPVTSIIVVYNGKGEEESIVTGSWDKTARKWDIQVRNNKVKLMAKTGQVQAIFKGHADFVKTVRYFGKFLYTGSSDKTIIQWDISSGEKMRTFKDHRRGVEDMVVDGKTIYSSSSDGTIKKWCVESGNLLMTFEGHLTSVYALMLSDGMLWSTSADKTVRRWDPETGKSDTILEHPDFVKSVTIYNQYVITGSRDENIRVWDSSNGKLISTLEGHFDEVTCLRVNGNTLFSGSLDGTIRQWDLKAIQSVKEEEVLTTDAQGMTAEEEAELAELMDQ